MAGSDKLGSTGFILLGLGLWAAACDAGGSYRIEVVFPDDAARQRAAQLRVGAIEPGPEAACAALLTVEAAPGDAGYTIEDDVRFPAAEPEQTRPLVGIGPGRRLFFAEARDADGELFLRACRALDAGGGGPDRVVLELEPVDVCQPSNGGVETCDGVDNDCDGQTDDGEPHFLCPEVPSATASACENGRCEYTCDEGWVDANGERSDGCECRPSRGGHEWCDGLDNDCDGQVDGPECTACASDADCDAPAWCLTGVCEAGVCQVETLPDGSDCDDGSVCTVGETCQSGMCLGEPVDCDDGDPCTDDGCDPDSGCTYAFNTADCDDGDPCTTADACDGNGACRGQPVVCDDPPPDTCLDADTARVHAPIGNCNPADGSCIYGHEDRDCAFGCSNGACRSSQCQGQPAGTACDDENACTVDDACDDDGVCRGAARVCDDENPCTDDGCEPDSGCTHTPNQAPCDDGDACTVGDVCQGGTCQGVAEDCDDGLDCTADECDPADSSCQNPIQPGWCAIDGACWPEGVHQVGEPCWVCDSASTQTAWTVDEGADCGNGLFCDGAEICDASGACISPGPPCTERCLGVCDEDLQACRPDPAGTACDDGIGCTLDDVCDGEGHCAGSPDDAFCADGLLCAPACAAAADGCTAPPDEVVLECPAEVPVGQPAQCTVYTPGAPIDAGCLGCRAFLVPKRIHRADFSADGNPDACDLDGWQFDDGPCGVPFGAPQCPMDPGGTACENEFDCPPSMGPLAGQPALEFEPMGWNSERRLVQRFELQPFVDVELCYSLAAVDPSSESVLQVQLDTGIVDHNHLLGCYYDLPLMEQIATRRCHRGLVDLLPDPMPRVAFWIAPDGATGALSLDDIELTGWWPECPPGVADVPLEDFSGCPGQLPDGYNGWSIQGEARCDNRLCDPELLLVRQGDTVVLERRIDTSGLAAPLKLCWMQGGKQMTQGVIAVEIDAGDGWRPVEEAAVAGDFDDWCGHHCTELTAADPAAADNSDLGIRLTLQSLDEELYFDDLVLDGADRCDAVELGLVELAGPHAVGDTEAVLDVGLLDGRAFDLELRCNWDQRAERQDDFRLRFVP